MPQQGFFNLLGCGRLAGQRKYVADHGLGLLVDAEGIAGNVAVLQSRVAGQHVAIEILRQQFDRAAVIPVQKPLPLFALGLQHRQQYRRRKVPQVEDLDGNARCHGSSSDDSGQLTVDSGQ